MGEVNLRRELPYPAAEVWPHIRDFRNIDRIMPAIDHADLVSGHDCGLGAERVCHMKGSGFTLTERVVDWKEGESYTIEVHRLTVPLVRRSRTTLGVRPVSPTRSEVFFRASYEVKYGWLGRVLDALMLNLMMRAMTSGVFGGLERQVLAARRAAPALTAAR